MRIESLLFCEMWMLEPKILKPDEVSRADFLSSLATKFERCSLVTSIAPPFLAPLQPFEETASHVPGKWDRIFDQITAGNSCEDILHNMHGAKNHARMEGSPCREKQFTSGPRMPFKLRDLAAWRG